MILRRPPQAAHSLRSEENTRASRAAHRRGLAVVPALGAAGVSHGIYTSYTRTRMPTVPLRYPDLPAELEGLKILHLSDIHNRAVRPARRS